jgi:hypothetical protein
VLSGELFSFQGFYFSASKVPETATKHSLAAIYSNNNSTEIEDYELMTGGTIQLSIWVPNCMELYPSRPQSFILFIKHTHKWVYDNILSTNELRKLNVLIF